jgi:Flp pilus assembly protein TadD
LTHHRNIWIATGFIVLFAAIILAVREVRAPIQPPIHDAVSELAHQLTPDQLAMVLQTMRDCLEKDPQARRAKTRAIVDTVAQLAESGETEAPGAYYALGLRRTALHDFAGAEAAYREAIAFERDWAWPYDGMGILLHAMDRRDEAEAFFLKAMELEPDWSRPHNNLAVMLRMSGRLEEARIEAERAIELAPQDVASHNNYGNLLVAMEDLEGAEAAYRKAIALEPDHPAPYYNLACLASLRGDRDDVVPLLMVAIRFDESYRRDARLDEDFDPMREDPLFRDLIRESSSR